MAGVDDSYTKSLLHFNGADTSTTFTDESGKTWTASGGAQLDTAQKEFGTASLLCDGTGDKIRTADTADHEVAAGDFTVDFWVRFNSVSTGGPQTFWSRRTVDGGAAQQDFFGTWYNDTTDLITFQSAASTVAKARYTCSWNPSTGVWYHLAYVRSGTSFYIFIDGQSQTLTEVTAISTNNLTFTYADQTEDKLTLGGYGSYDGYYLNGWIDEFRFSKGIARWTSNFTPPTAEYAPPLAGGNDWPIMTGKKFWGPRYSS